jgi:hypothetical protein
MDDRLARLIGEIKTNYPPADKFSLRVSYFPYKNVSHTIRLRGQIIYVRISDKLVNAPDKIIRALGTILLDKLFRKKADKKQRQLYRTYLNGFIIPQLPANKRKISGEYTAQGRFYDLDTIFDKINRQYFNFTLQKPHLGWSLNRSTHRLGFYDAERNLLVISRIFDRRKVPQFVLDFLMYHEMLHIVLPVIHNNGRRTVHSAEFKTKERSFVEFDQAQTWLRKKLWRLSF